MHSWFSCEKYTESASKQLDQQLSTYELIRYYFHHIICLSCRRFLKQIKFIDKASCSQHFIEKNQEINFSEEKLSEIENSLR